MKNLKYLIGIVAVFFSIIYFAVLWKVIKLPAGQNPIIFRETVVYEEPNDIVDGEKEVEFKSDQERNLFIVGIKNDLFVIDADDSNDEIIKEENKKIRDRILSTLNPEDYRLKGDEQTAWIIPYFSIELTENGYIAIKDHPLITGIQLDVPIGFD
jgi:hypothetical protein